ncbi:MAG: glycoside hydrolase family 2 TIM barrel-domain containing protein, partial [Mangrovibacterium sp.]
QRLLFDMDWRFHPGDPDGAENINYKDNDWRVLNLPHDWSIEGEYDEQAITGGSGGYLPAGIGWYRKHFKLPATSQNLWIEFDGVYMNSEVWINGHSLGKHVNGYTSFYYDITPHIKNGDNVIAVKVDNSVQTNSRWYSGSGIYRHVWLTRANPLHIPQWGTYITTTRADSLSATLSVLIRIENKGTVTGKAVLRSEIIDGNGKTVTVADTLIPVKAGGEAGISQQLHVAKPLLWSVGTPSLYTLRSTVMVGKKTIDEVKTPFGIRTIAYDARKGFLLNGRQVKMNGVCLHHDAGCLGAAVPIQVWERRLRLLKEMGCNAIRTSHNAVAPEFLDLCDSIGFLVMDEPFDEWEEAKSNTTSAYHLYFKENWKDDLISFIHRDRNHPSVVIWSAGNEIPDQSTERGQEVLRQLLYVFHAEDPTRPVTTANDRIAADDNPALLPFLEMEDVVGYNYVDRWHERRELYYSVDKLDHPGWKMIGTENVSVGGVRGAYSLDDGTRGSRGSYASSMIRAEQLWKFTALHDYVCGDFMWTGIDYLGESRWPGRSSNSGVLDLAGFPKDGYYFYQSQWTKKPMIHLFPHWNWKGKKGQIIPVLAYSNCDAVELFLNGKSCGEKKLEFPRPGTSGSWAHYDKPPLNAATADLHLSWDVPYEPGELKAVGKINGDIVCTETVKTAGEPAALRLTSDKETLRANGQDVVHLTVEIVDSNGVVVPDANNEIHFTVNGEARLIGVENGNSLDHSPPKATVKKAFNGLILGIVQATRKAGAVSVEVSSPGIKGAAVKMTAQ